MENYKLQLSRTLLYGIIKEHYGVTAVGDSFTYIIRVAEREFGLSRVTACVFDLMFNVKLDLEELNNIDDDSFCELVSLYDDLGNFEVEYGCD